MFIILPVQIRKKENLNVDGNDGKKNLQLIFSLSDYLYFFNFKKNIKQQTLFFWLISV